MSVSTAIALIIASFFPALFCFLYAAKMTGDIFDETVTGVVAGNPMPMKFRQIRFYTLSMTYALSATVCEIGTALLNLRIAQQVADADVKALAHVFMAIAAIAAAGALAATALASLYVLSRFRESTGD